MKSCNILQCLYMGVLTFLCGGTTMGLTFDLVAGFPRSGLWLLLVASHGTRYTIPQSSFFSSHSFTLSSFRGELGLGGPPGPPQLRGLHTGHSIKAVISSAHLHMGVHHIGSVVAV